MVEYGYDNLNRLISEKRNGIVELDDSYTYDPVGNRLTRATLGGWDAAGNLISRSGPEGQTTYRYDAENRLVEMSGPGGVVQYAFDAEGNRISRTTAAGTTYFVVDPNMPYAQVLEEHGPAGAKLYAYGNDMLNIQGPDGTHWFAYDGLGSVRALTDASGTLTDAYTYEAFGSVAHRIGTTANDFRFTGEQYDEALEMYYLRARYYEPETGRFSQADPWDGNIIKPGSLHKYIYTENNPVNNIDPTGLFTLGQAVMAGAIIGTLAGIGYTHFFGKDKSVWGYVQSAVFGAGIGIALSSGVYYIYYAITGVSAAASWAQKSASASGPGWVLGKLFEDWHYKFYGVGEKCAQVVIEGIGRIDAQVGSIVIELKNYNWANYSSLRSLVTKFTERAARYSQVIGTEINGYVIEKVKFVFSTKPPNEIIRALERLGILVDWITK